MARNRAEVDGIFIYPARRGRREIVLVFDGCTAEVALHGETRITHCVSSPSFFIGFSFRSSAGVVIFSKYLITAPGWTAFHFPHPHFTHKGLKPPPSFLFHIVLWILVFDLLLGSAILCLTARDRERRVPRRGQGRGCAARAKVSSNRSRPLTAVGWRYAERTGEAEYRWL